MQNIRAILVYLAIMGALVAAVVAGALFAWPWAVAAAMWPAENAVRAYEQVAAHGLVTWIQAKQNVDWYGWVAWWRHGPWPRVHQLGTRTTHWNRVLVVCAAETLLVGSLLTLSPLRKIWPTLWFVMGRMGHLRPGRTHGTAPGARREGCGRGPGGRRSTSAGGVGAGSVCPGSKPCWAC